MELKEAVRLAKGYVAQLFADEHIENLGLEEVEFDPQEDAWRVTLGFSRVWNADQSNALAAALMARRAQKTVHISNATHEIVAVKEFHRG